MKIDMIKALGVTAALSLSLSGCMEEVSPFDSITKEQVESLASSQEAMLGGIVAYTNEKNVQGYSTGYWSYYTNDYGYSCQMFYRDVLTADIPISSSATFNYWQYVEGATDLRNYSLFTYSYYYHFIKNCNDLIATIDTTSASSTSLNYLGCALAFRALCYFDLARSFEFQKTGIATLDDAATEVYGLTVPIVTENTTPAEAAQNPRVPFYTMYRFILNDLTNAAAFLDGYERPNGNYINQDVVYGLMARFWLELGTRFYKTPDDLTTQLAHESDEDGYKALGITNANDCYKKAAEYAQKLEGKYTPVSRAEWTNKTTGFNTAVDAWLLYMSISTQEQEGYYYSSFIGTICTEATWAMPQYGASYREISSTLYNSMSDKDWRKNSWIDPDDAGSAPDAKYNAACDDETFALFPAYTNLKFRARDIDNLTEGMKCDIPMMRIEEMYFIDAEATAHTDGVAAGAAKLNSFMNSYRYTDGSYNCTLTDLNLFTTELIKQKRIEFWGEGISMFDYKRLKMAVNRTANENYGSLFQQDSKDGYVSPSMNYFIPDYATSMNSALLLNPDCTGWDKY